MLTVSSMMLGSLWFCIYWNGWQDIIIIHCIDMTVSHFSVSPICCLCIVDCVCICRLSNITQPKSHQQIRQSTFWLVKLFFSCVEKKWHIFPAIYQDIFNGVRKCDHGKCQSFISDAKEWSEYAAIKSLHHRLLWLVELSGKRRGWKVSTINSANAPTDWLCNGEGKIWKYLFKLDHYVFGQFHVLEHPL